MTDTAIVADLRDRRQARGVRLMRTRPRLMRTLGRVRLVILGVTLVLLAVTSVVEFAVLKAVAHALLMVATVLIALLLTPTRSVTIGVALRWLAISATVAPVIALVSFGVAALAGVPAGYDGAETVIAGVVEEIGKLAPLAALALTGPNALRRLNRTDWLVLGYVSGAGFAVVEESLRVLYYNVGAGDSVVAFAQLEGLHNPRFTLNPLGLAGVAENVTGHAVWTCLVVGAVGLAFRLAAHRPGRLWFTAILPLGALAAVIGDHASSNAALIVTGGGQELLARGSPEAVILGLLRFALLDGWLVIAAVVALWCWALATDAVDRHRRPDTGLTATSRRRVGRVRARGRAGLVLAGPTAIVVNWRDDLMRTLRAVGRLPRSRTGLALLSLALTLGPAGRRASGPFPAPGVRVAALVFLTTVVPAGLLVAVFGAAAVGSTLSTADGGLPWDWLTGLLDGLSVWWNDLAWYHQALIVSFLGLGLMMLFPAMPAAAVLQALGWATSMATYGGPLAAVLQNPGLVKDYLLTRGPRQIAVDLAVLLLNYPIPMTRGAFTRDVFGLLFPGNPQLAQATAAEFYQGATLYGDQWAAEFLVDELGLPSDAALEQELGKLSNPYLAALNHYTATP